MIYTCVIITDHNEEVKFLKNQIAVHNELELTASYPNIYNVPASVYSHIAFININDSVMNGQDQFNLMRSNFEFIIFTGDRDECARIAYDMDGLDYLSKPIEPSRFNQAFYKVTRSALNAQKPKITMNSLFAIKDVHDERNWVINTYNDVVAVESDKNYLKIYTTASFHITYLSLSKFEFNVLNLPNFIKVHRSFIVSKNHLQKITNHNIYMKGVTVKIPIGINYRKNLQEFIDGVSLNRK
ncbi:LytR/AlgR family response regulator transcription factor [Pedobacter ginsengisoli]|uniref:LytR/AlgR family response regulator transcription factor n=1 Tax=Pedobacter ginsengisoli TaxID=363852 RepID=UPI00254EFC87|nr:LytTR family transcriptional regulator DNA-binding domain-containing protein [Pedobacter ginsengisoli]